MDVHASEKEQVEVLRKWWKDNGSSVITGILLGVSVLLGGKAWFSYQENQALNASNLYQQMMEAVDAGEPEKVRTLANQLIGEFPSTAYASLAALLLARQAVDDGELAAAEAQLQWAMDHASSPEIVATARMRLVRLMIDQTAYAQAERLLSAEPDPEAYAYVYSELKGDLALAQGETARAAEAYKTALDKAPAQAPNRALLTAKYESVSTADTEQE
jgi:predicted negative regulator of RcsB-dependent stress response